MARPWIRLYTDLRHNAKIQRLPDHLFRFVINCWCLTGASENESLPSVEEIAFELRIDPGICQAYIDHLLQQNILIKRKHTGMLAPYHWDTRQFLSDSSLDRVRKFRERKEKSVMKRYSNGDVTVQDSDSDTDSDQTHTQKDEMRPEFDDQFQEYKSLFGQASSKPVMPEDFTEAWHAWKILDFEQKSAVLESLRQRIEGMAFLGHTPNSYLVKREWKRPVKPPAKPVAVAKPYRDDFMSLEQQKERDEAIARERREKWGTA